MIAAAPLISIRHITKRYPGVVALDDVTFDVAVGELRAIVRRERGGQEHADEKFSAGVVTEFDGELRLA